MKYFVTEMAFTLDIIEKKLTKLELEKGLGVMIFKMWFE